ncbi:methyl-accepting chemotaxis protein [Rhodobacteraceae bacterium CH30]|nr:methyl-accepting chemotaxis protein [Rhodobacteraceae bacterium CH30]
MSMRSKLYLLVALAVSGLIVLGMTALYMQRQALLDDRIDKVKGLVESTVSMVGFYEDEARQGRLATEQAQRLALAAISRQRFDGEEYFFVLDRELSWIAHGVNPKLVGQSIRGKTDANGADLGALFGTSIQRGGGVVEYVWAKPGAAAPVGKISYVASSKDWGWSVGTGIYIDDIDAFFWRQAIMLLGVGTLVMLALLVASTLIIRGLLKGLGGDPAYAIEVVKVIASGHLGQHVKVRDGDTESLIAAIGQMQDQLKDLIGNIIDSADKLGDMAEGIERHAEVNAGNSEQQSQAAASMAAAIEELTTSIHHIADHAGMAREQSQASGEISRESGEVITRAVSEIEGISREVGTASVSIAELTDKTASIRSIMEVISDVADQTNLLALNAAIEAARAGEQGRGFAVVADEVRKLAERTSQSTQQIAAMIAAIQGVSDASIHTIGDAVKRAENGVALAEQGGQAIVRIQQSASSIVAVVSDISHSLTEQSQASSEIARHVEQISQGAASNAVVAHETSKATVALHQLTHQLRETVATFRL